MLLQGLHIPLTTPFHPDGRLNPHKLAANVARYSKTSAAGLIILGPSGEPTLLSDDETRQTLLTAAEAAAPEKVLIAGIARDSVRETLALATLAAAQNYDAILIGAPSIAATTGRSRHRYDELLLFLLTIADRSPLPVVLLRSGARPAIREVFAALISHPNIIGMVYSSRAASVQRYELKLLLEHTAATRREITVTHTFAAVTARMKIAAESMRPTPLISALSLAGATTAVAEPPPLAPVLRTRTRVLGFQVLGSSSATLFDALSSGAAGIAPAFAACAPQACYEVFAAWKDSDLPLAEEKQSRLREAAGLAEENPGLLKFGCDLNGYFGGMPRLPHLPPGAAQRTALHSRMEGIR